MKYTNSICMTLFLITLIQSLTFKINDNNQISAEQESINQSDTHVDGAIKPAPLEKKQVENITEEKVEKPQKTEARDDASVVKNTVTKEVDKPNLSEETQTSAQPADSQPPTNLVAKTVSNSQLRKTKETDEELLAKYSFENVKYVKEISQVGKITLEKKEE